MSAAGIPQLAAIMGNCVAGGAYLPVMCDTLVMYVFNCDIVHIHLTLFELIVNFVILNEIFIPCNFIHKYMYMIKNGKVIY